LLIQALPSLPAGRMLCNTVGRAQLAAAYAVRHPESPVVCWMLDLYVLRESQAVVAPLPNLHLVCQADPPAAAYDVVLWAVRRHGEGELVREMLQLGHQHLTDDGVLGAAVDHPDDQWLHRQLHELFHKVTRKPHRRGVAYLCRRKRPRKLKDYAAEFPFRDGPRRIMLRTRPGVFSHREVDGGTRALIKTMQVPPAGRVLDLGCGSGAAGIAAVLRDERVRLDALDSNPRALEAVAWAAQHNGVADRVRTILACDAEGVSPASYDLVLANPPYYSQYRLAELFVQAARKGLRPGGTLLLVTKATAWYRQHLPLWFSELAEHAVGGYTVFQARLPPKPAAAP
jgi:16S rRNA (guanine1207-N2)-methyltransferase